MNPKYSHGTEIEVAVRWLRSCLIGMEMNQLHSGPVLGPNQSIPSPHL